MANNAEEDQTQQVVDAAISLPLANVVVLFAVRPCFQWGMQGWVMCMMWPTGLNNVRRKASAGVFTFIHGSQG
jgi:hypothetical protein